MKNKFHKNLAYSAKHKHNNFDDKIYTPTEIVKEIIKWVKPYGSVLEPFRGEGAFYDELFKEKDIYHLEWAEKEKGRDFFNVNTKYDFIITNPPYSIFTEALEHCFKIANNVVLLIPHMKIFASDKRLNMVEEFGTFEYKRFKSPREWKNNFPIAAYWFKKKEV